jgi:NIPSNAP
MVHELRIYHVTPGSMGRLHTRFSTMTLGHFARHGIRPVAFWDVTIGDGSNAKMFYILEWESLAEREEKWNAFQADPAWQSDRAETEKAGAIVAKVESLILTPTAYSPKKQLLG